MSDRQQTAIYYLFNALLSGKSDVNIPKCITNKCYQSKERGPNYVKADLHKYTPLKQLRISLGLKQKDVFEKLGVSEAKYSKWERGKQKHPNDLLDKIRSIFS